LNMMRTRRTERKAKPCGCTGVRWCAACTDPELRRAHKMDPALPLPPLLSTCPDQGTSGVFEFDPVTQSAPGCPEFRGVCVVPDFLSPVDEKRLLAQIDETPFLLAQSGKQKQHHGAKVNFNKKKLNAAAYRGLPPYSAPLEKRLVSRFSSVSSSSAENDAQKARALASYETTDLFVLRYQREDASNLDFHIDDTFAYGEAIIDISLESDSVMTFIRTGSENHRNGGIECVRVPLPAGSAALLYGTARYEWEHAILFYDITDQRTSITLRTLSESLRDTEEGQRILTTSRSGSRSRLS
jgi:DNA N6-methyl adenine demethylase